MLKKIGYTTILKGAITIALYWILLDRLSDFSHWPTILSTILKDKSRFIVVLTALFLLAGANLLTEALKWQKLLSFSKNNYNLNSCIKSVFTGFAAGVATPNNLGEIGGRIRFLPKEHQISGGTLFVFGSIIQTIIISVFGIISVFTFATEYYSSSIQQLKTPIFSNKIILSSLLFVTLSVSIIVLKRHTIKQWSIIQKFFPIRLVLSQLTLRYTLSITLITITRYCIFCLQLSILLWFYSSENLSLIHLQSILIYYFLVTIIPSFFWIDLGIRGSIALFVFYATQIPAEYIVSAVFTLWIINVSIPSAIGSIFLLHKKPSNKKIHIVI